MHRSSFNQAYQNGGRSPYAAYAKAAPNERNLSDLYHYIDDDQNILSPSATRAPVFEDDNEPDIIHISFRGESSLLDFPPYSIAEEKIQVRHVRDRVAVRLGLEGQEGRVKLLYKDRELKRNDAPLRKYGCKQDSEIVVIVLQEPRDYTSRKYHSASDSDSHAPHVRKNADEGRPNRSNSTYRKRDDEPRSAYPSSAGFLHPHDTPTTGNTSPRQQSPNRSIDHQRQPSPSRPTNSARRSPVTAPSGSPRLPSVPTVGPPTADLSTDLGKVQKMRYDFHAQYHPLIEKFLQSPPADRDDRHKEYLRLSEMVYKKVFEAGDAIEPSGSDKEEIRATRKQLYNEAQAVLHELDRSEASK